MGLLQKILLALRDCPHPRPNSMPMPTLVPRRDVGPKLVQTQGQAHPARTEGARPEDSVCCGEELATEGTAVETGL